ncbi:MAG: hypothetical protein FJ128_12575 [Deltaproteobacteria bacterium]|nr:hypothetical protein [Deltaproteobacteria bacterium]
MLLRIFTLFLSLSLSVALTLPAGAMEYNFRPETERMRLQHRGEPSSTAMFWDAAIARPLGLAATAAGATMFVLLLPFTAGREGRVEKSGEGLVRRPGQWTFKRPLGTQTPQYQERPLR